MRLQARRTLIAAALSILCATAGAREAAPASKTLSFSITAPSLVQALIQFTEQSGLQLAFPTQGFRHLPAPPVIGELTPRDALERLLKDSGLRFEFTNEHTVAIYATTTADGVSGRGDGGVSVEQPQSMRLAQSGGQPPADGTGPAVEEVVVTGKIIFMQNDAFGATKLGLPVKDTPQTVSVVTSDLMRFASMRAFDDFYKVDASSGTSHAIDGFPVNFYRGFLQQGNNAVRVDGFRMPGNIDLDLALFDRFEVIKGPTSTLYGQNSIGGTLNAVSKLPQARAVRELSFEGGQYDDYRLDADLTGPLGASGALSYRLIGAYADAESFIDFVNKDVQLLSPSIVYQPDDATRLLLRVAYQKVSDRFHRQAALQLRGEGTGPLLERVLTEGLQIVDLPRSRFYSMPWNHDRREALFVQFQGERRLGNGWTLRAHAQHNDVDQWINGFYTGGPIDQNGVTYYNEIFASTLDNELDGAELNLFGDLEAFGRRHTLFFGVDYSRIRGSGKSDFGSNYGEGFESSVFNVFRPDYAAVPELTPYTTGYGFCGDSVSSTKLFGATVQLVLRPTDRLSLLLGARHSNDRIVETYRNAEGAFSNVELATPYQLINSKFSKEVFQGGLTFALTDAVNVYASYGETFEGQYGRAFSEDDPAGKPILPQEGTNYEIGLKGDLARDLSFSVAAFDMKRSNISQDDFAHIGFLAPLGTQRGRGVELGLQGRLLPQLSINASAAYLDAEYTDGELKGLQPVNAPKIGLSVFGSYELLAGALKGLGFGLGVVHKRDIVGFDYGWTLEAGRPVTFDFGDFTEIDARVFYDVGRWSLALSATNLLNEEYYSQTDNSLWFMTNVNPPRTLRARATYRF